MDFTSAWVCRNHWWNIDNDSTILSFGSIVPFPVMVGILVFPVAQNLAVLPLNLILLANDLWFTDDNRA